MMKLLRAQQRAIGPAIGTTVAFKAASSEPLAGLPATITQLWPRCSSGDYLVTLTYAQPVKFRTTFIQHIEAFASELNVVHAPEQEGSGMPVTSDAHCVRRP